MTEIKMRNKAGSGDGYVLHIHNSTAEVTQHPTLDHALTHASHVAATENSQRAMRATVVRPDGLKEMHTVEPMNEAAMARHKDNIKSGSYRPGKPVE